MCIGSQNRFVRDVFMHKQGKPKTCKRVGINFKNTIMKKIKISLAVFAVLIAIGSVLAFTGKKTTMKKNNVIYHYTSGSDQLEDMQDTTNWVIVAEPSGCGEYGDLPCSKTFIDDRDEFKEYLDGFGSAEALTLDVDSRKND